jgi:hypothetical protein
MPKAAPVKMTCMYHIKKGKEAAFRRLLERHWPALFAAGLATDEPAIVFRCESKRTGRVSFLEQFSWKNSNASAIAHETPAVTAIWEPMMPLLENMELFKTASVAMPFDKPARRK